MVNAPAGRFRCAVGADIIRPVVFPLGKQRRRIAPTMHHQTFANEIRLYYVGTWYIVQHCYISRPIRFCSKICDVGGRLIAAPTQMYHIVHGAYFQAVNIFEFVGTDIIRPVVSPWGNNVGALRRQCNIEHCTVKFGATMSKRGIFGNIGTPPGQIGSAQKPATLAGGRRPYTDVPHRTWCVFCRRSIFFEFVGAAISRPVVSPRGNNVGALRRQWHHRTFANEFWRYYVGTWYIAARCAARFPRGIAGRMISAPTLVRATLAGGCHQLTLCAARAASTTHPLFSLLLSIKDKVLLK